MSDQHNEERLCKRWHEQASSYREVEPLCTRLPRVHTIVGSLTRMYYNITCVFIVCIAIDLSLMVIETYLKMAIGIDLLS
jgi:hypothetical protein